MKAALGSFIAKLQIKYHTNEKKNPIFFIGKYLTK